MGFLDFLFDKEKAHEKRLKKLKKTLTHMYVQAAERQYAVETLREMNTPESIKILLTRFQETNPNHTTDADEKQYVYSVLVDLGRRGDTDVIGVVTEYLKTIDENINWPLKVLTDLVSYEQMVELIIELLEDLNVYYQRSPEKKRELMLRAAEFQDPKLAEQVARFLEDDNETIRFLAVDALMAQEEDELAEEPLRARLREEDSIRTLQKLAEIFVDKPGWKIPDEEREDIDELLPDGFGVHKSGHIYRKKK